MTTALSATLAPYYRRAKQATWGQFGFHLLGAVGAFNGHWLVCAHALAIVCAGLGIHAMWKSKRVLADELERLYPPKQYPPGCACIRGAMLDNPSCPHHRGEAPAP